jgi:hypothetical protein
LLNPEFARVFNKDAVFQSKTSYKPERRILIIRLMGIKHDMDELKDEVFDMYKLGWKYNVFVDLTSLIYKTF